MFATLRIATLSAALLVTATAAYSAAYSAEDTARYGNAAPAAAAQRHVTITADTRHVNVTDGDTVEFQGEGGSFTWQFSTLRGEGSVELDKIAPAGLVNRKITVYVAPNPLYRG